jgi:hypothetical protein
VTPLGGGTEGKAATGREYTSQNGMDASKRMARKSRQMPVKKKEGKERRKFWYSSENTL